ncbi:MAG TPA: LeuA family protein [Blastocatellia bacterium]|nr:LeuA family protein [Blastocatellia bacterium]
MLINDLIYDWNQESPISLPPGRKVYLNDETLRDGMQSPSVSDPPIGMKIELLHLMEALRIHSLNIGLPGAGGTHAAAVGRLAREIADQRMNIYPNCLARADLSDIRPIIDISQEAGIPIEAAIFVGSSPIRFYAEDWTLDKLLRLTEQAVSFAVKEGLPVLFATEDTTRSTPETIRALFTTAIRCGATALGIADTVGHVTPNGARAIARFIREIAIKEGGGIRIDWHGHQDRGLGVINSIAALEGGADRVHGTALGIGERVGNTPMDQLLVNLKLMGWIDNDLSLLGRYCNLAADACGWTIPPNYPVFGRDAFRTATGIHAAALIKGYKKGDVDLVDVIYSGVPARAFGQRQVIEIGPMSGKSNVIYWLNTHGIEATENRVSRIFDYAKSSISVLEEDEILDLLQEASVANGRSTVP